MATTTLVTGLDGFVGGHFPEGCVNLVAAGGRVDLRDRAAVRSAIAAIAPDRVVHLAAQSFVPRSFDDPEETFAINFHGTFNLLQGLKDIGFTGRLLHVGSGDMYGLVTEDMLPISEAAPLRPRSPYGVSKVAAEALVHQWAVSGCGFDCIMARSFNHIGPGQSPRFAVADFAGQIMAVRRGEREPVLQVGDVDATRDFTDVRDVVAAYLALLDKGANGGIYNVCSGQERSLRAMIDGLAAAADVTVELQQDPARMRPSEQRRVRGDCSRITGDTGWTPSIALEQTLSDILTHLEETH